MSLGAHEPWFAELGIEGGEARTNSRSHVGVLCDFEWALRDALDEKPTWDLLEASRWLAETPIIARNLFPDIATRELFGAPRPDRRRAH